MNNTLKIVAVCISFIIFGIYEIVEAGITESTVAFNPAKTKESTEAPKLSPSKQYIGEIHKLENGNYMIYLSNNNLRSWAEIQNKIEELARNKNLEIPQSDQIEVLQLQNNALESFNGFPDMPQLRYLNINNNHFTSFEGMPEFPKLEMLCVDDNQLINLNGFNRKLVLSTLTLNNNQLDSVRLSPYDLPKLQTLQIAGNRLTSLDQISDFRNLETIDVSKNQLTSFDANKIYIHFPSLKKLDLRHNHITKDNIVGEINPFLEVLLDTSLE